MNSRSLAIVLVLAFTFALAGCQQRAATKPETTRQDQQDTTQKKDQQMIDEKKLDSKISSSDKDTGSSYVESKDSLFADVLFEFDKYDVKDTYKSNLQSVSSWMSKNSTARLSIEGHCDDRGTNEYNLALGDRRAKAVRDYLVSLGVASGRIDIISYGEEKPLCTDQTEDCWARNRRAHFVILTKAGK